jgi:hypothetical protein
LAGLIAAAHLICDIFGIRALDGPPLPCSFACRWQSGALDVGGCVQAQGFPTVSTRWPTGWRLERLKKFGRREGEMNSRFHNTFWLRRNSIRAKNISGGISSPG